MGSRGPRPVWLSFFFTGTPSSMAFDIVARLQVQAVGVSRAVSEITSAVRSANANVDVSVNTGRAVGQARAVTEALGQLRSQAASAGAAAASSLDRASSAMERFGDVAGVSLRRFAAFTLAVGGVTAIAGAVREATTAALEFERAMVRIRQVTEDNGATAREASQEIGRIATQYGVSSSELANAAQIFAQAGIKGKELADSLRTVADAALAPNFDSMASSADGMIAVMRQFRTDAVGTREAIGSMNAVAGEFAVEGRDLIEVVKRAGGAFSQTGGDLNQLLALFTSVRATTRESAQEISTGLRTIFTRLQRPETVEALQQMQVQLRYTRDEARALGDMGLKDQFVGAYEAVRRISTGLSSLRSTDPRFSGIVEAVGGSRQASRILPLIKEFDTAQKALGVAQAGGSSLNRSTEISQESLVQSTGRVREQFLELFRTISQSEGFQAFAKGALQLASALGTVLDYARPLIPLLTTLATIKLAEGIGAFAGSFFARATFTAPGDVPKKAQGGPIYKSGPVDLTPGEFVMPPGRLPSPSLSRLNRYADGGWVVPGVGNTDSYRANLRAGSYVIRKDSALAIGHDNLASLASGRRPRAFAAGGPARLSPLPSSQRASLKELRLSLAQLADVDPVNDPRGLDYGDYVKKLGEMALAGDSLSYIPKGSRFIGSGLAAVALRSLDGDVIRVQPEGVEEMANAHLKRSRRARGINHEPLPPSTLSVFRPNIPGVLQARAAGLIGRGTYLERLPFAENVPFANESRAHLRAVAQLRRLVNSGGYDLQDIHSQNIGVVGGQYLVRDPGSVAPLAPNQLHLMEEAKRALELARIDTEVPARRASGGYVGAVNPFLFARKNRAAPDFLRADGFGKKMGRAQRYAGGGLATLDGSIRQYLREIGRSTNVDVAQYDPSSLFGLHQQFPEAMSNSYGVAAPPQNGNASILSFNPRAKKNIGRPGFYYNIAHELGHILDYATSSKINFHEEDDDFTVDRGGNAFQKLVDLHKGPLTQLALKADRLDADYLKYLLDPAEVAADAFAYGVSGIARSGNGRPTARVPKGYADTFGFVQDELLPYLRDSFGPYDPRKRYASGGLADVFTKYGRHDDPEHAISLSEIALANSKVAHDTLGSHGFGFLGNAVPEGLLSPQQYGAPAFPPPSLEEAFKRTGLGARFFSGVSTGGATRYQAALRGDDIPYGSAIGTHEENYRALFSAIGSSAFELGQQGGFGDFANLREVFPQLHVPLLAAAQSALPGVESPFGDEKQFLPGQIEEYRRSKADLLGLIDYIQDAPAKKRTLDKDNLNLSSVVRGLSGPDGLSSTLALFETPLLLTPSHHGELLAHILAQKNSRRWHEYAEGGLSSSSSSIPALLMPGEFVINPPAAEKLGLKTLDHMNRHGEIPAFHTGGYVGRGGEKRVGFAAGGPVRFSDGGGVGGGGSLEEAAAHISDAAAALENAADKQDSAADAMEQAAQAVAAPRENVRQSNRAAQMRARKAEQRAAGLAPSREEIAAAGQAGEYAPDPAYLATRAFTPQPNALPTLADVARRQSSEYARRPLNIPALAEQLAEEKRLQEAAEQRQKQSEALAQQKETTAQETARKRQEQNSKFAADPEALKIAKLATARAGGLLGQGREDIVQQGLLKTISEFDPGQAKKGETGQAAFNRVLRANTFGVLRDEAKRLNAEKGNRSLNAKGAGSASELGELVGDGEGLADTRQATVKDTAEAYRLQLQETARFLGVKFPEKATDAQLEFLHREYEKIKPSERGRYANLGKEIGPKDLAQLANQAEKDGYSPGTELGDTRSFPGFINLLEQQRVRSTAGKARALAGLGGGPLTIPGTNISLVGGQVSEKALNQLVGSIGSLPPEELADIGPLSLKRSQASQLARAVSGGYVGIGEGLRALKGRQEAEAAAAGGGKKNAGGSGGGRGKGPGGPPAGPPDEGDDDFIGPARPSVRAQKELEKLKDELGEQAINRGGILGEGGQKLSDIVQVRRYGPTAIPGLEPGATILGDAAGYNKQIFIDADPSKLEAQKAKGRAQVAALSSLIPPDRLAEDDARVAGKDAGGLTPEYSEAAYQAKLQDLHGRGPNPRREPPAPPPPPREGVGQDVVAGLLSDRENDPELVRRELARRRRAQYDTSVPVADRPDTDDPDVNSLRGAEALAARRERLRATREIIRRSIESTAEYNRQQEEGKARKSSGEQAESDKQIADTQLRRAIGPSINRAMRYGVPGAQLEDVADILQKRSAVPAEQEIARRGPLVSQDSRNAILLNELTNQETILRRELLSAQRRLLATIYPNANATELEKTAHEEVERALRGEAAIIRDASGRVLGTSQRVAELAARPGAVPPPGAGPPSLTEVAGGYLGGLFGRLVGGASGGLGRAREFFGVDSFNKSFEGVGQGLGTTALLALPYLSSGISSIGGDVQSAVAGGSTATYTGANVVSGGLQGALLGGTLGAQIPGLGAFGGAIGAAVGAVQGMVSAYRQAAKEIQEVKIGVALRIASDNFNALANLNALPEDSVDRPTYIASARASLNDALEAISQRNADAATSLYGFGPLDVAKFEGLQKRSYTNELGGLVPVATQAINQDISRLIKINPGAGLDVLLAKFRDGGNGFTREMIDLIARVRHVPIELVQKQFERTLVNLRRQEQAEVATLAARERNERSVNAFGRIPAAIASAQDFAAEGLQGVQAQQAAFSGQFFAARPSAGLGGLTQLGRGDEKALDTLRLIRGSGAFGGEELFRAGATVNRLQPVLTSVLSAIAGQGLSGVDADVTFGSRAESLVREQLGAKPGQDQELDAALSIVRSGLSELSGNGKGVRGITDEVKVDVTKLADRLLAKFADPVRDAGGKAGKLIEEAGARLTDALKQSAEQAALVEELSFRRDQGLMAGERARAGIAADRSFGSPLDFLTLEQTLQPERERLRRLTGQASPDADEIGRRLAEVQAKIPGAARAQREAFLDKGAGKAFEEAAGRLSGLNEEAARLRLALSVLADASTKSAAIQERIGRINEDRSSRLSFGQDYLSQNFEGRARIQRGVVLAAAAHERGNLEGFVPEDQQLIIETLRRFGRSKLTGFGGVRADQELNRLTGKSIDGVLGLDAGAEEEKGGLEQKLIKAFEEENKARAKLVENQQRSQQGLLDGLRGIHESFLARLERVFTSDKVASLESRRGAVGAKIGEVSKLAKSAGLLGEFGVENDAGVRALIDRQKELSGIREAVRKRRDAEANDQKAIDQILLDAENGTGMFESFSGDTRGLFKQPYVKTNVDRAGVSKYLQGLNVGSVGPTTDLLNRSDVYLNFLNGKTIESPGNTTVNDFRKKIADILVSSIRDRADYKDLDKGVDDAQRKFGVVPGLDHGKLFEAVSGDRGPAIFQALEDLGRSPIKFQELAKETKTLEAEFRKLTGRINELTGGPQKTATDAASGAIGGALLSRGGIAPSYLASGGVLGMHPGAPRGADTLPAWLQPGEGVLRKDAVDRIGRDGFHALNEGRAAVARFSRGGVAYMDGGGVAELFGYAGRLAGAGIERGINVPLDLLANRFRKKPILINPYSPLFFPEAAQKFKDREEKREHEKARKKFLEEEAEKEAANRKAVEEFEKRRPKELKADELDFTDIDNIPGPAPLAPPAPPAFRFQPEIPVGDIAPQVPRPDVDAAVVAAANAARRPQPQPEDDPLGRELRLQAAINPFGASAGILQRELLEKRFLPFGGDRNRIGNRDVSKADNAISAALLARSTVGKARSLASQQAAVRGSGFARADAEGGRNIYLRALQRKAEQDRLAENQDLRTRLYKNQRLPLPALGFATGGVVPSVPEAGGTGRDAVVGVLGAGEAVLNARAVSRIGAPAVHYLNQGGVAQPIYAAAGKVAERIPGYFNPETGPAISPEVAQAMGRMSEGMSAFVATLPSLSSSLDAFARSADKLSEALSRFPGTLNVTGRQDVNITLNGAEALARMTPEIEKMVAEKVKDGIGQAFKKFLPDAGVNLE